MWILKFQDAVNSSPAEPGYTLSLQTVKVQMKPTDLDLYCLTFKYVNLY